MRTSSAESFFTKRWPARFAGPVIVLACLSAGTVLAQQPAFHPANGQSPQQQGQDLAACQNVAAQQSGAGQSAATTPARTGGRARGAAVGAATAAITGNDAGKGAAAGMVGGAAAQRGARRQDQRQAAAQQQQSATAANSALIGCMQGKGYTASQ